MAPRAILDRSDRQLLVGALIVTLLVLWSLLMLGVGIGLSVRAFHWITGG